MLHWDFFFLLTYYQQRVCKLALGEWKLLFKNIWILRNWTSKRNIKTVKKKKFIHICRLCARIKHFALINASFQRLANEKDFFYSFYTFSPSFSFSFFSLYVLFRFFSVESIDRSQDIRSITDLCPECTKDYGPTIYVYSKVWKVKFAVGNR